MDRQYLSGNQTNNAHGYGAGGTAEVTQVMTHTESATNSLQNLLASLNDSNARLQEARDRMFGCNPTEANKEPPRAVPNGRADEIDMLLAACHGAAERTSILACELLRRL